MVYAPECLSPPAGEGLCRPWQHTSSQAGTQQGFRKQDGGRSLCSPGVSVMQSQVQSPGQAGVSPSDCHRNLSPGPLRSPLAKPSGTSSCVLPAHLGPPLASFLHFPRRGRATPQPLCHGHTAPLPRSLWPGKDTFFSSGSHPQTPACHEWARVPGGMGASQW